MRLGLGLARRNGNPALAFINSNGGAFWDFRTFDGAWQTDDTSSPVTAAGHDIGREASRTGAFVMAQATAGSRPTMQAGYAEFDGTADNLLGDAAVNGLARAISHLVIGCSFAPDSVSATQRLVQVGANFSGGIRAGIALTSGNRLFFDGRRLDGDTGLGFASTTANTATIGQRLTAIIVVSYANTGLVTIYRNGVADGTGTLNGTPAATSNTASAVVRLGASAATTAANFLDGKMYTACIVPALPDAGQLAALNAMLSA